MSKYAWRDSNPHRDEQIRLAGLEPTTGRLEGGCSVQLSYRRVSSLYRPKPASGTALAVQTPPAGGAMSLRQRRSWQVHHANPVAGLRPADEQFQELRRDGPRGRCRRPSETEVPAADVGEPGPLGVGQIFRVR